MSDPLPEVSELITRRSAAKKVRLDALRAFGLEEEKTDAKRLVEKRTLHVVSERVLHMDKITAKLRTDIPGFLKKYFDFPDDEYPETNGTVPHVITLLEEMMIGGRIVAEFATDHVKSVGSSEFYPIISLAENPNEAHIIVGANFADSKRRIQVVQRHLEGNHELLRDFPWLKKPERPKGGGSSGIAWSRVELTVSGRDTNRPNPSIYACATGSNDIRGRRGKLIMDDIEGEEHRHFASKRAALYDFVKLEAVRCLEDTHESTRPLLIALGTPFDVESIYFKLEREGWRVLKVPAYTVDWKEVKEFAYAFGTDTHTPWQDRAANVPEKYFTWPRKRFKIASQDPVFGKGMTIKQFSIAYLLDPAAGDSTRLSMEQMERLIKSTETPNEMDYQTFVSLDPAAGTKSRFSDYAGITVVKIRWPLTDKLPEVHVLEAHAFEEGLIEQVDLAATLARQYNCSVMFETNAQQGGNYRDVFNHRQPDIRLVEHYTTHQAKVDEDNGLTVIKTLMKNGKLKSPTSQVESEGIQQLLKEIGSLGSDYHDHLSMSIWFTYQWLFKQVRIFRDTAVPSRMTKRFGASTGGYFRSHSMARRTWRR